MEIIRSCFSILSEKSALKRIFVKYSVCRLLTLSILFTSSSSAQLETLREAWRWVQFTTESGLPSNEVHDILETSDGTVWAATAAGLAWYDGFRWHESKISKGLIDQLPILIGEDSETELALIINGMIYKGGKLGFHHFPVSTEGKPNMITSAAVYNRGFLIIDHYQLFYCDSQSVHAFSNPLSETERLAIWNATKIWKPRSKKIWFNCLKGLYSWEDGRWKLRLGGKDHVFWVRKIEERFRDKGLAAVDLQLNDVGIWEWDSGKDPRQSSTERNQPVKTFDIAPNGDVIAVYESGEIRIRRKEVWSTFDPVTSEFTGVLFVKFRENGDLWVGTERGLYLHRSSSSLWTYAKHEFSDTRNTIVEIYMARDSSLWLGTSRGVEIREPNGRLRWIEKIDGKSLGIVTGINQDKEGDFWVSSGASFEGAYRWNGRDWKHYGDSEGLSAPFIHKISRDRNGDLWFLGLGRDYNPKKRQPGAFKYSEGHFIRWGTEEGLTNGRVYGFAEGKDGAYWFATFQGLSKWDKNRWTNFPWIRVFAVAIDGNQKVWFSDQASGLGLVDRDSVKIITVSDGLLDHEIHDLRVDSKGTLWISTKKGLCSYSNGVWATYDARSGLSTLQLRAILPTEDKVYIGSQGGGLAILNLKEVRHPTLTEISTPVIENASALLRWKVFGFWGSPASNEIETRFRVDKRDWFQWSRTREVNLQSLSSGEHEFEVQARSSYGSSGNSNQSLRFRVPPPYYRRADFLLPIGFLFLTSVYLTVAAAKRKRSHRLELQQDRERIASDLHDEVGSNLGSMALMSQALQKRRGLPPVYRKELTRIAQTAMTTAETLHEIVWYVNPQRDSVGNLVVKMREFTDRLFVNTDYTFTVERVVKTKAMDVQVRRNLFLMFKEVIYNAAKHSHATVVHVRITQKISSFHFQVIDNGRGFNPQAESSGQGLSNLHSRADTIGAALSIESSPNSGTVITISVSIA